MLKVTASLITKSKVDVLYVYIGYTRDTWPRYRMTNFQRRRIDSLYHISIPSRTLDSGCLLLLLFIIIVYLWLYIAKCDAKINSYIVCEADDNGDDAYI